MLLRQDRILLKRTSKKFINLLLLLIIPFTAFYVKKICRWKKKSTVFICGYYMEESNSYLAQVEQELSGHQDCFTFEKCSSLEELKGSGCIRAV